MLIVAAALNYSFEVNEDALDEPILKEICRSQRVRWRTASRKEFK
jgi:hypothetical protein